MENGFGFGKTVRNLRKTNGLMFLVLGIGWMKMDIELQAGKQ